MLRFLLLILCLNLAFDTPSFKSQQLQFPRVRTAKAEKDSLCRKLFAEKGISNISNIFLRAFKSEGVLELWAKAGKTYVKIQDYEICTASGGPGPKVKMGDGQVPEGFYEIDRFNPQSNFYLSLGVNYPNKADKLRNSTNPGGDIFIHGNCVSIGCMPLTDEYIKELYWICVLAKNAGQAKIPVHIFPCRLSPSNLEKLKKLRKEYKSFWENLKEGYDYFEEQKVPPAVSVNSDGAYTFRAASR
jgi:murein L,D-transpeptidase YafK